MNYLCEDVAVMSMGRIVEAGTRYEVCSHPRHSYTRDQIAAVRAPTTGRSGLATVAGSR